MDLSKKKGENDRIRVIERSSKTGNNGDLSFSLFYNRAGTLNVSMVYQIIGPFSYRRVFKVLTH